MGTVSFVKVLAVQAPIAVQNVALVEVQLSVELSPLTMVAGFAVSITDGFAWTVTIAVALAPVAGSDAVIVTGLILSAMPETWPLDGSTLAIVGASEAHVRGADHLPVFVPSVTFAMRSSVSPTTTVPELGTISSSETVKFTVLVVLAISPVVSATEKSTGVAACRVDGVPSTAPVLVSKVRPDGKLGPAEYVYGGTPSAAVRGSNGVTVETLTQSSCGVSVAVAVIAHSG